MLPGRQHFPRAIFHARHLGGGAGERFVGGPVWSLVAVTGNLTLGALQRRGLQLARTRIFLPCNESVMVMMMRNMNAKRLQQLA